MLACRIKGHRPTADLVWNDGRHFSHCRRCGSEIMRGKSMVWQKPPAGMKTVWRSNDPFDTAPRAEDASLLEGASSLK